MPRKGRLHPRGFLSASLTWVAAFGVLALLSPVSDALAQQTGTISGRVTDEQGNAIPGAEVVIEAIRKGALTNASGNYIVADVPAGTHTVRVRFIGYRPQTAEVSVSPGGEATQSFTLAIDPLGLEELVVTATNEPRVKLQSSTAITTMTRQDIEEAEPRSTADLLKDVPGFYVESSGGEVNNNLFARGLPADGSYRYVVLLENGIAAHDANDLFFIGADNFIRIDENIETVEAVRGGNSALFGSNAPGGVVNFIDKTGGSDLAASLKVSAATGGLARYDANINGPFSDDWRFSIGGFYRYDDGIRDPGFAASRGGQLKANITRLLDNGYFRVYAKYLNDKNVFYLPLPLVPGEQDGDVVKLQDETVAGFPDDGTLTTNDGNQVRVPLPLGNGELTLPLDNGIAQTGGTLMADLRLTFGDGWTIQNTARAMNLDHQWNALVPFEIVDASQFVADSLASLDTLGFPGATGSVTYADDGSAFSTPNDLLNVAGEWHIEKPLTNFSNQFQVRKSLATGETRHDLTLGTYFGFYTADNLWFFNDILTDVRTQPRFVDVVFRDATGGIISATENGFRRYVSLYVNGFGRATLFSVYGADEIQLSERLRLDVGARFEHADYTQNAENSTTFDLGNDSTTADDAVNWGTRTFTRRNVSFDEWAASVGVNYSLSDQTALYVRASRGYKMPLIDQYLFEQFPDTAETLWQAEAGLKMSTPTLGLSAVGYFLILENFPSQDARIVGGTPVFVTALVGKARTIGAEVEAVVAPAPGFRLNGVGTFQFHEYTEFIEGGDTLNGNWVRRIPQVVLNVGGRYSASGFTIGGDYNFYGKRFSNNANTIELPSFGYANARASYRFPGQGVTISAAVLNAFDGQGLTEGNPRLDESGAPAGPALARPILPRRFEASIRYDF